MDVTSIEKLAAGMSIPLLIVVALVYGWMIVGYGVMFWHTRRAYPLNKLVLWTIFCSIALVQTWNLTGPNGLLVDRHDLYGWRMLLLNIFGYTVYIVWPMVMIYQRWHGRAKEPGYAHARDLLLLRQPAASRQPDMRLGEIFDLGGFVRSLPKIVALSIAITLGFFLLTKLIFGFGPFF